MCFHYWNLYSIAVLSFKLLNVIIWTKKWFPNGNTSQAKCRFNLQTSNLTATEQIHKPWAPQNRDDNINSAKYIGAINKFFLFGPLRILIANEWLKYPKVMQTKWEERKTNRIKVKPQDYRNANKQSINQFNVKIIIATFVPFKCFLVKSSCQKNDEFHREYSSWLYICWCCWFWIRISIIQLRFNCSGRTWKINFHLKLSINNVICNKMMS